MESTMQRGNAGEALAMEFLQGQGFRIIATKFRHGRGEIDIVGEDGGELVFVEVKTRTTARFGEPEESVTGSKERMIRSAAIGFCRRRGMMERFYRFDIVSVMFRGEIVVVKHVRNVFPF